MLGLVLISLIDRSLCDFVIENGQVSVLDSSGITSKSLKFSTEEKPKTDTKLDAGDGNTLKVTFDIFGKLSGHSNKEPILPSQLNLLATGLDSNLHWVSVIKARNNGKAKWELDLARAPTDFLSLSPTGQVSIDLVIGDRSPNHPPLKLRLFTLNLSKELILNYPYWDTKDGKPPAALELEKYYVKSNLQWTFQPPRKPDNPIISLIFMGLVLSPWLILFATWPKLSNGSIPSLRLLSSPSKSTTIFIATILSQEVLILTYWARLRLYHYLPIAFLLSLPLIFSGRSALSELRVKRKKHPIKGTHLVNNSDGKGKQKGE
ncbi:Dolichyl-diphosphooligosaccharide--protein glycosyltransferase subunit Swp1 [Phakopsora pachyrhizi]|nr:Dolichyl-diphosphooligosaccharide--protein glycosyltransferase subunit Swp1 [Phakopsora pachyrhizi]CAH7688817.1 Dolichyl-diphosphooligosaccharide--protein glycosyltransferase subunit Swp1 [Phakopsora pachyrhizi]